LRVNTGKADVAGFVEGFVVGWLCRRVGRKGERMLRLRTRRGLGRGLGTVCRLLRGFGNDGAREIKILGKYLTEKEGVIAWNYR